MLCARFSDQAYKQQKELASKHYDQVSKPALSYVHDDKEHPVISGNWALQVDSRGFQGHWAIDVVTLASDLICDISFLICKLSVVTVTL